MERLKLAAFSAAQALWLGLRGAGRALLGAERFDRLVGLTGLRRLKARNWLSEAALPDGGRLLHRPLDQCIIDEIYGKDVYSREAFRPGQTVVDVGGHIGTFSVMAGRRVGAGGRVIVCEPSPGSLDLLRRNLELNGLSWAHVHPVAVAEKEGELSFYTAADGEQNPVGDTLVPSASRRAVTVRVRTLDALLAEEGVDAIDHLKVDAEGAELRVLDGGAKALAAARRVVMEVHTPPVPREEALERLRGAGFKLRVMHEDAHSLVVEGTR